MKCSPATTETPSGTQVLVVEDVGTGVTITRTRSEPWALGSKRDPGDHVVLLEGRTGGYLLERVFVVPPAAAIGAAGDEVTLRNITRILSAYVGEAGESEGAVDVLERIVRERAAAVALSEQRRRALAFAQSMIRSGESETDRSRAVFRAAFDGLPEPELMAPPESSVGTGG